MSGLVTLASALGPRRLKPAMTSPCWIAGVKSTVVGVGALASMNVTSAAPSDCWML